MMRNIFGKEKDKYEFAILLMLTATVSFFLVAWLMTTYEAWKGRGLALGIVAFALTFLCWGLGNFSCKKAKNENLLRQLFLVNSCMAVFALLVLAFGGARTILQDQKYGYIIPFVMSVLVCGALAIAERANRPQLDVKTFLPAHKWILAEIIVFAILVALQSDILSRWDENVVFNAMQKFGIYSVFDVISMATASHLSMGWTVLNVLLGVLFGDAALGLVAGNLILYLGSIVCVYGIIGELFFGKTDAEKAGLSAIWAFSPFALGLVDICIWDVWMMYLFPILFYFALVKKWLLHLITASVFCFSKEPAIVCYAFFCAGIVIDDFAEKRGMKFRERCREIFKQKKIYGMLLLGLLWLGFYMVMPKWPVNGSGFEWSISYAISKLKVLFVLNFNWLLLLFACLGFVFSLCKRGDKTVYRKLLPLILGDLAFVGLSCAFQTFNHARYIDSHSAALALLGIIGICQLSFTVLRRVAIAGVTVLMAISNYRVIDPVSLHAFTSFSVGTTTMITTGGVGLSDSIVYNQQYRFFDKALDMAIEDTLQEEDGLFVFPYLADSAWSFEGPRTFPFERCSITEADDVTTILGEKTGYYFYISFCGETITEHLLETVQILEETTFSYGGFEVHRVKFIG